MLEPEEIDRNAATFQDQAFKVIDPERTEVRRNGEWLDMPMEDLLRLVRTVTVARVLERDDFQQRIEAGRPISVLELLYPVLQGYDSVAVEADVELGGTDQKFNLLFGRDVQQAYGQEPQAIITMPILPGIDGERRMSKSLRQLHRSDGSARGDVRQADERARRRHGHLLRAAAGRGAGPGRARRGGEARARAADRGAIPRRAGRRSRPKRHFDRLHKDHRPPEEIEEVKLSAAS